MGAEGARGVLLATASTAIVIGVVVFVALHSSHWLEFKQAFFNAKVLGDRSPTSFVRSARTSSTS